MILECYQCATELTHVFFVLYKIQDSRCYVEVLNAFGAEVSTGVGIKIWSHYSMDVYSVFLEDVVDNDVFSDTSVYFSHLCQIEYGYMNTG